jgi:hypothetical protein
VVIVDMGDRYFPGTAIGGRLYLDGSGVYYDEAVVDMLVERVGHRKVRTEVKLLAAAKESERGLASHQSVDTRSTGGSCEETLLRAGI